MAGEVDLFGKRIEQEAPRKPSRTTNDMGVIEKVLRIACGEGYALVGQHERVCRTGAKDPDGYAEITTVNSDEAVAVHQLIDGKYLLVGGQHPYRYRNHREAYGRAVLVPQKTRGRSARWDILHRPSTWIDTGGTERKGR